MLDKPILAIVVSVIVIVVVAVGLMWPVHGDDDDF